MHARTYAQTVCTHARMHAPTYTRILACIRGMCAYLDACTHAHMHACPHVFALRCVALLYFACALACWLASLRFFALLRFHATLLAYDLLSFLCEQAMLCDNSLPTELARKKPRQTKPRPCMQPPQSCHLKTPTMHAATPKLPPHASIQERASTSETCNHTLRNIK